MAKHRAQQLCLTLAALLLACAILSHSAAAEQGRKSGPAARTLQSTDAAGIKASAFHFRVANGAVTKDDDGSAAATVPSPPPPPPATAPRGTAGPCSAAVITINVATMADFRARTMWSPVQTVLLLVQNDIQLLSTLWMGANYSCTIIRPATGAAGAKLYATWDNAPLISMTGTSNIMIDSMGLQTGVNANSTMCPFLDPNGDFDTGAADPTVKCPAVWAWGTSGLQIVRSTVWGRIDIARSNYSLIDSNNLSGLGGDVALVRVEQSGDGPWLVKCNITISNNFFTGGQSVVFLLNHVVGASILNNYFKNFTWAAIQLGSAGLVNGNAIINTVAHNYIYSGPSEVKVANNAGIYTDLHWNSPGNVLNCNYIVGGENCVYLDYVTSFITMTGVCLLNRIGVKIATGSFNNIPSLLVIKVAGQIGRAGYIECINWNVNSCSQKHGCYWNMALKYQYDTPPFQAAFPVLNDYCSLTSVNGVACNPNATAAAMSGNCSGIPIGNYFTPILIDAPTPQYNPPFWHYTCTSQYFTNPAQLNTMTLMNTPVFNSTYAQFLNAAGGDYGLMPSSPIYQVQPNFVSCPLADVGPKAVDPNSYYLNFNSFGRPLMTRASIANPHLMNISLCPAN